jgi:AcrR family transcriptional regulator
MIAAGMRILSERGIAGLTLKAVGVGAELSRGAPGYQFNDRAGLVDAIVIELLTEFNLSNFGDAKKRGADRLTGMRIDFFSRVSQRPFAFKAYLVVLAEAHTDTKIHARVAEANVRDLNFLERELQWGIENGVVRSTTAPRAIATTLLAFLRGAPELWLFDKSMTLGVIGGEFATLFMPV